MRSLLLVVAALTVPATALADDDPCAPDPPDPAPAPPCPVPPAPPAKPGTVRVTGTVVDKQAGLPLAGVTIIAERGGGFPAEAAISDETGAYVLDVPPATYTFTMYYLELAVVTATNVPIGETTSLGVFRLDDSYHDCCFCFDFAEHPGADLTSSPRYGLVVRGDHLLPARDRTHRAWIAPVAGADPLTSVTTVQTAARLQSAPGIPVAFVEEVETHTLRIPIAKAAGGGGGTDVTLRYGTNEPHAEARAVLGLDGGGGGEAVASGPLARDSAWFAAGLVANRASDDVLDASGMVHLNYAISPEHQVEVSSLAQAHGDDTRDGWAAARWNLKLFGARLELGALATAEQLTVPAAAARATLPLGNVTDRAGGQLGFKWRVRGLGYHQIAATAGGGAGDRGDDRHSDVTLAAGDDWQIRPNLELHAGVRSDTRTFGLARATITSPRLSLTWDPTKEGRADVFVAYQRVPHLDDGMPGDWLASDARFHDEVAGGVNYLRDTDWPMVGVAVRERGDDTGVEGWLRYQTRKTLVHVGATTLGRIATALVERTLVDGSRDDLLAGLTLRAAPDHTESGGAVVWKHTGNREAKTADVRVTAEGYAGTEGPGARVLLGVGW